VVRAYDLLLMRGSSNRVRRPNLLPNSFGTRCRRGRRMICRSRLADADAMPLRQGARRITRIPAAIVSVRFLSRPASADLFPLKTGGAATGQPLDGARRSHQYGDPAGFPALAPRLQSPRGIARYRRDPAVS